MILYGVIVYERIHDGGGVLSTGRYRYFTLTPERAQQLKEQVSKDEPYEWGVTKEYDVVPRKIDDYFLEYIWEPRKLDTQGANITRMRLGEWSEMTGKLGAKPLDTYRAEDGKEYTLLSVDYSRLSCEVFVEAGK